MTALITIKDAAMTKGGAPEPTVNARELWKKLESNEQGRKIRQYFIEAEKRFRGLAEASKNYIDSSIGCFMADTIAKMQEETRTWIELERRTARAETLLELSKNFLPDGKPGDLNKDGVPKTKFRRWYYCTNKGKPVTALIERMYQPGLFDQIDLQPVTGLLNGGKDE